MATIADLTGETISSSYGTLLMVTDTAGITSDLQTVQSGLGVGDNVSALKLSSSVVQVDGDLGVGVVPKSWIPSATPVQVGATSSLFNTSASTSLGENVYRHTDDWRFITTGYAAKLDVGGGEFNFYQSTASGSADGTVTWATNPLTIDTSGNVGIGGTPPATAKLYVDGKIHLNNNNGIVQKDSSGTAFTLISIYDDDSTKIHDGDITIDSSGNVGIGGAPNAAYVLDVREDADADTILNLTNGGQSTDGRTTAIQFGKDNGTDESGVLGYVADAVAANTAITLNHFGHSDQFTLLNSGNVGIGGTPVSVSGAGSPVLDIRGSIPEICLTDTDADKNDWYIRISDGLQFGEGTDSRVYFENGGNVGIGTTDPGAKLHIEESSSGALVTPLKLINPNQAVDSAVAIDFKLSADSVSAAAQLKAISPTTGADGDFVISTRESGVGLAERMRIDSSGNVDVATGGVRVAGTPDESSDDPMIGMGVISDVPTLFSLDTTPLAFKTGGSERMRIDSSGDVSIASGKLMLGAAAVVDPATPAVDGYLYLSGDSDQYIKGDAGSNWMALFTANAEAMRIDSDGNVGIGTTVAGRDADLTLEVAGTFGVDEHIYHNGDHDTYMRFGSDEWEVVTGATSEIKVDGGNVLLPNLPTSDPEIAGALYSDGATSAGVPKALMISGGAA